MKPNSHSKEERTMEKVFTIMALILVLYHVSMTLSCAKAFSQTKVDTSTQARNLPPTNTIHHQPILQRFETSTVFAPFKESQAPEKPGETCAHGGWAKSLPDAQGKVNLFFCLQVAPDKSFRWLKVPAEQY